MNKYKAESRKAQRANKRLRSCESKQAYSTEEEAHQKGQRSYKCRYCGKWHRTGSFTKLVRTIEERSKMVKTYEATGYDKATGQKKTIPIEATTSKEAKTKAHQWLTKPRIRRI